jgi:hypothetical protein
MPIELQHFLHARGFRTHPFRTVNAEQERAELPAYFVRVPWFDQLVGDPQHPESLVLFAPPGHGKTSHRLEVARRASEPNRMHRALTVVLNDVDALLAGGIEHITVNTYIEPIRRKTLEVLARHLQEAPEETLDNLRHDAETLARLAALLHHYALRAVLPFAPSEQAVNHYLQVYQHSRLDPREWLKDELAPLVYGAGFASVYVLIDGLDESHLTRKDQDAMLRLLSPLLDNPGLLQGCGFAFKFFLPHNVQEPLLREEVGRFDRIPAHVISWSEDDLVKMLSQRLSAFSYHTRFKELCDVDFDVDVRLAQAAGASPREMVRLAGKIFDEHCTHTHHVDDLISAETVQRVLDAHAASPVDPIGATVAPDGPPPLFFDARGDICLGARRLDANLAKTPKIILKFLWENRHRAVAYEELYIAIWGVKPTEGESKWPTDPRNSCHKHVQTLRSILEPGQTDSETYIEVQRGIGYVLRNFREDAEQ